MKRTMLAIVLVPAAALLLLLGAVQGAEAERGLKQRPTRVYPKSSDVIIDPFQPVTRNLEPGDPTYLDSIQAQPISQRNLSVWERFFLRMQQEIGLVGMMSLLTLLTILNCWMFWRKIVAPYMEKQWKK